MVEFDNTRVESNSIKELYRSVSEYYQYQDQDIPEDLEQLIVCQICERVGSGWCREESEGPGDTLKKVFHVTGVAKMHARMTGHKLTPCKTCGQRQNWLNKAAPYRRNRG